MILDIIDSYIYSLKGLPISKTLKRVATQEFIASLNRKSIIPNDLYDDIMTYAMERIDAENP